MDGSNNAVHGAGDDQHQSQDDFPAGERRAAPWNPTKSLSFEKIENPGTYISSSVTTDLFTRVDNYIKPDSTTDYSSAIKQIKKFVGSSSAVAQAAPAIPEQYLKGAHAKDRELAKFCASSRKELERHEHAVSKISELLTLAKDAEQDKLQDLADQTFHAIEALLASIAIHKENIKQRERKIVSETLKVHTQKVNPFVRTDAPIIDESFRSQIHSQYEEQALRRQAQPPANAFTRGRSRGRRGGQYGRNEGNGFRHDFPRGGGSDYGRGRGRSRGPPPPRDHAPERD
jgi:hypothetical protein